MKLIKLSEEHYVVVDDSEIKEGDFVYSSDGGIFKRHIDNPCQTIFPISKVTHSTNIDWHEIYYIPLSEVKELFSEDTDVWSRKLEYLKKVDENIKHKSQDERIWIFGASDLGFTAGYKQGLEDNRGKKYTEDDMIEWAMCMIAQYVHGNTNIWNKDLLRESLPQPQTEWDVEFDEHGKLTLV